MATLSEGIQTNWDNYIRSPGGATLEAAAAFTNICDTAAARVKMKLGDVDSDSENYLVAVMYGIMFAMEAWASRLERKLNAEEQRLYDGLRKDWDDVNEILRHEAQDIGVGEPHTDSLDATFPLLQTETDEDE